MALRKETIKAVCEEMARAHLELGENILVGALTVIGPGGYWQRGMSSFNYYTVVTDQRVLFIRTTLIGIRPKFIEHADGRAGARIESVRREFDPRFDLSMFTTVIEYRYGKLKLPLHLSRRWREEADKLIRVLSTADAAGRPSGDGGRIETSS